MAHPKKSLAQLCADRTFLARRHADLLVSEPLLDDLALRDLQRQYRQESSDLERRRIALELERRSPSSGGPTKQLTRTSPSACRRSLHRR